MIDARSIHKRLLRFTCQNSGHEAARDYLGMSQIYREEDELVEMLASGTAWQPTARDHLRLYLGYLFEHDIKDRLIRAGLCSDEMLYPDDDGLLVATFDPRFRGHIDGVFPSGDLLEIKSTHHDKLDRIRRDRRLPRSHYEQVQMYLFHGGFAEQGRSGFVVYVARDSGLLYVREVRPNDRVIEKLNEKAARVLRRVDRQQQAA